MEQTVNLSYVGSIPTFPAIGAKSVKQLLRIKIKVAEQESRFIRKDQNYLLKKVKPLSLEDQCLLATQTFLNEAIGAKLLDPKHVHPDRIIQFRELRLRKKLHRAKLAEIKMAGPWSSLQYKRRDVLGWEQRHNLLAYSFLRGKGYPEKRYHNHPGWLYVEKLIRKYSEEKDSRVLDQKIEEWVQNGKQNQIDSKADEGKTNVGVAA